MDKKLVSVKIPKKTAAQLKKENIVCGPGSDTERYPYGLMLRFNKEEVEKINALQSIKADAEVYISAKGFVKEVRTLDVSKKSGERARESVEIQITDIGIKLDLKKKPEDMSPEEYKEWRK